MNDAVGWIFVLAWCLILITWKWILALAVIAIAGFVALRIARRGRR